MKTKRLLQFGFIVCICLLFGSVAVFAIFEHYSPQEPTANHIIEMHSHGEIFYITLAQYILLACVACTGGLGIIILGVIHMLRNKHGKFKPKEL